MRATTMTSLKTMNTLAGRYGSKMRSIHVFLSIDYCFDACCCCCFSLRSLVARALSSNAIALASISISFSFKAFCLNSLDSRVVGTAEEALFLGVGVRRCSCQTPFHLEFILESDACIDGFPVRAI